MRHPTDSHRCDVCHILDLLLQSNLTLAFVGDSMMRQSFAGLQCEIYRRGYQIEIVEERKFNDSTPHIGAGYKYQISDRTRMRVSYSDPENDETGVPSATILYYGMYRPNSASYVRHILPVSDIVVFDHSLWYKFYEMQRFESDMTKLLQTLVFGDAKESSSIRRPQMVVWREQSAQHFDAPGGHYGQPANGTSCVPLRQASYEYHHVKVVEKVVQKVNISLISPLEATNGDAEKSLHFFPFRNYTAPFSDLHPGECTHYCHTPFLWLPFWRMLSLAMDQQGF